MQEIVTDPALMKCWILLWVGLSHNVGEREGVEAFERCELCTFGTSYVQPRYFEPKFNRRQSPSRLKEGYGAYHTTVHKP